MPPYKWFKMGAASQSLKNLAKPIHAFLPGKQTQADQNAKAASPVRERPLLNAKRIPRYFMRVQVCDLPMSEKPM